MKKEITGSWKKYHDYRFIAGEDLTKDVQLTIKAVGIDEAFNGKTKEDVMVLGFVETDKMVVLNKTNAKILQKITGSQLVEEWKGHQVTLTAKTVNAFGQQMLAVRIKEDHSGVKV